MRIAFVGCGAAGRPLGRAWAAGGHEVGAVRTRSPASAAAAVAAMGHGVAGGSLDDADVVVFATPDDALAAVAAEHRLAATQTALHLSGIHPSTLLAPTGARTASLHPLRAFADLAIDFSATWCFVEGDAVAVAETLAGDLGGPVARIDTGQKTLYHAAAALASNFSVTLLAVARDLFVAAGVEEPAARAALASLVGGAAANVGRVGLPAALTGPAARGDIDVVARHLAALDEETRALYRTLLAATIPLARAKGALSAEAEAALRRLAT